MKLTIKALGAALLAGLVFLGGCANPLIERRASGGAEGRGLVTVRMGSAARTLQPDLSGFTKYDGVFTRTEPAATESVTLTGAASTVELLPGDWTVAVTAWKGDAKAAVGSAAVKVETGKEAAVTVALLPYTGEGAAQGTLSYAVTFPPGVESGSLALADPAGAAVGAAIDLLANKTGSRTLDPGSYRLLIRLTEGSLVAGRTEALHVYPGLTTAAVYDFTAADFVAFAEADDVTVAGTVGTALDAEVTIRLYNDTFSDAVTVGMDVSGSITNLPAGLAATVKAITVDTITLGIGGAPTEARDAELAVTIPGVALSSGAALAVRPNGNAKFAIVPLVPALTVVAHAGGPDTGVIELAWENLGAGPFTVTWGTTNDESAATGAKSVNDGESSTVIEALTLGATYYVWVNGIAGGPDTVHFTEADLANIGVDPAFPLDGSYALTRDLDLAGFTVQEDAEEAPIYGWLPIGAYKDLKFGFPEAVTADKCFSGTFDGNGKVIRNLELAQYETEGVGLFGVVYGADGNHAVIKNLTIELADNAEVSLTSKNAQYAGLVSGYALYADFESITVTVQGGVTIEKTVTGVQLTNNDDSYYYFGGITGYASNVSIANCRSELEIEAVQTITGATRVLPMYVGGLAGRMYIGTLNLSTSSHTGSISAENNVTGTDATGNLYAGGLAGEGGSISGSHASGNITADSSGAAQVGGLTGSGAATESYFDGSITVTAVDLVYAGGIAGQNTSLIDSCWTKGGGITAFSEKNSPRAGGISGGNGNYAITNCWSEMQEIKATATDTINVVISRASPAYAGGIATGSTGYVQNCYSAVQKITVIAGTTTGRAVAGGISTNGGSPANYKGNVVRLGTIEITGATNANANLDSAVRRICAASDPAEAIKTLNVASSEDVVMIKNSVTLTPAENTVVNDKRDGLDKTAAQLENSDFYFNATDHGTLPGLGWDTNKWTWDTGAKRPRLSWES